ncbi:hypothetical protein H4R35_003957 [Dimargaris xerosporica]|nr:hypothetical protein H4R35_003957 [Dimargaris xerosporica]
MSPHKRARLTASSAGTVVTGRMTRAQARKNRQQAAAGNTMQSSPDTIGPKVTEQRLEHSTSAEADTDVVLVPTDIEPIPFEGTSDPESEFEEVEIPQDGPDAVAIPATATASEDYCQATTLTPFPIDSKAADYDTPTSPYDPYAEYLATQANDGDDGDAMDAESTDALILTFSPDDRPDIATTAKSASSGIRASITKRDRERRKATHMAYLLFTLAQLQRLNRLANTEIVQAMLYSLIPADIAANLMAAFGTPASTLHGSAAGRSSTRLAFGSSRGKTALDASAPAKDSLRALVTWWRSVFTTHVSCGPWTNTTITRYIDNMAKALVKKEPDDQGVDKTDNNPELQRLLTGIACRQGSAVDSAVLLTAALRILGVSARLVVSIHPPPLQLTRCEVEREMHGEVWLDFAECGVWERTPTKGLHSGSRALNGKRYHPMTWWCEARLPGTRGRWVCVDDIRGLVDEPKRMEEWLQAYPPPTLQQTHGNQNQPSVSSNCELVSVGDAKPAPLTSSRSPGHIPVVYVVAVDALGFWKDVTQRYAATWSTQTQKRRITSTTVFNTSLQNANDKDNIHTNGSTPQLAAMAGTRWWRRTLNRYTKPYHTASDDEEERELSQAKVAEAMPTSFAGIKGHPLFVLERHLKQTEVIYPRDPVLGRIRGEPVFPRTNVCLLRSCEHWFRHGRQVKADEEPLKHVSARRSTRKLAANANDLDSAVSQHSYGDDSSGTGQVPLFAEWQTQVYQPPPVADGQISKNRYGHVDLFVPGMLPAGAAHIPMEGVGTVARQLGIDYAPAVVGFDFSARSGSGSSRPVTMGIVIPAEAKAMLLEAFYAKQEHRFAQLTAQREARLWALWRRIIVGAQIKARLMQRYGDVLAQEHEEQQQ